MIRSLNSGWWCYSYPGTNLFFCYRPFGNKKRKQEKSKENKKKRDKLQDGHSWLVFGASGDSRGDFFHDWASVPLQLAPTSTTLPHFTILPHQLHRITVTHYYKTTPHTTTQTKSNYHTVPQSQSVRARATQRQLNFTTTQPHGHTTTLLNKSTMPTGNIYSNGFTIHLSLQTSDWEILSTLRMFTAEVSQPQRHWLWRDKERAY